MMCRGGNVAWPKLRLGDRRGGGAAAAGAAGSGGEEARLMTMMMMMMRGQAADDLIGIIGCPVPRIARPYVIFGYKTLTPLGTLKYAD
jgi:hypothetical protein